MDSSLFKGIQSQEKRLYNADAMPLQREKAAIEGDTACRFEIGGNYGGIRRWERCGAL